MAVSTTWPTVSLPSTGTPWLTTRNMPSSAPMGRRIALSSQPLTVGVITRSGALSHSGVQV